MKSLACEIRIRWVELVGALYLELNSPVSSWYEFARSPRKEVIKMGVLPCSSLEEQMRVKWKTLAVAMASLTAGAILYTVLFVQFQQGHRLREVSRTDLEVDGLLLAGETMPDASYQRHGRRLVGSQESNHDHYRRSISKLKEDLAQLTSHLRLPPKHVSHDSAHLRDTPTKDHSDTRNDSGRFHVKQPFHFPQPHYSKPDSFLLQSRWVQQLHDFLSTVEGNQVSLVTANQEHQDVVLNWLISAYMVAKPAVKNVLVLTLDKPLHDLLKGRGIPTLYISPGMVIDPSAGITRAFSQVHIVRLTLVRLINNYGFDLVNYDSDAILLKNPQPYFDKYTHADIIGTFGKGPASLFREWGVTLNTGVLLFRSNDNVGECREDEHA